MQWLIDMIGDAFTASVPMWAILLEAVLYALAIIYSYARMLSPDEAAELIIDEREDARRDERRKQATFAREEYARGYADGCSTASDYNRKGDYQNGRIEGGAGR